MASPVAADPREGTAPMVYETILYDEDGPIGNLTLNKTAFSARHDGVGGLARLAHDSLLRQYLGSEESHELGQVFAERRQLDPAKLGH